MEPISIIKPVPNFRDLSPLYSLLKAFCEEPFAQEANLAGKSLSDVANYLESVREQFENVQEEASEVEHFQSFDRVKDMFCSLLLELDQGDIFPLMSESIEDLLGREEGTSIMVRPILASGAVDESVTGALAISDIPDPTNGVREISPFDPLSEILSSLCPDSKEYFAMALHFGIHRSSLPFNPDRLERLTWQYFFFSLESECAGRLKPGLWNFWRKKTRYIHSVVNGQAKKFELNPALACWILELASRKRELLHEGKFPTNGILNSLRFILATSELQNFVPSLLEAGILVLLFGIEVSEDDFALKNVIKLRGLTLDESMELSLHLMRAQKLKNVAMQVGSHVTANNFQASPQWLERVFALLLKIKFPDSA